MTHGKFIVIDGSDGSGKKTQSDLLIESLRSEGRDVVFYDFPQYYNTFFGKMVGEFLTGKFGAPQNVDPYVASLLYAGDRWQASPKIRADLEAGKIVISNRYTSSNMAHQAGKIKNKKKKEEYLDWLDELEFKIYGIPRPDLVLYLYVPFNVTLDLLESKEKRNYVGKKAKDGVEADQNYLKNSIKEYLRLTDKYPNWQKVDCTKADKLLTIEEIHEKVYKTVCSEIETIIEKVEAGVEEIISEISPKELACEPAINELEAR